MRLRSKRSEVEVKWAIFATVDLNQRPDMEGWLSGKPSLENKSQTGASYLSSPLRTLRL